MVNEEEKEQLQNVNSVEIGDLKIISTKESLKKCVSTAKEILKDETASNYLNINLPKKRFNGL